MLANTGFAEFEVSWNVDFFLVSVEFEPGRRAVVVLLGLVAERSATYRRILVKNRTCQHSASSLIHCDPKLSFMLV